MIDNLNISLTPFEAISLRDWLSVTSGNLDVIPEAEALSKCIQEYIKQVEEQLTPEIIDDAAAEEAMYRLLGKEPG